MVLRWIAPFTKSFPRRLKAFNMFGMGQYEKVGDTAKVTFTSSLLLLLFFTSLSLSFCRSFFSSWCPNSLSLSLAFGKREDASLSLSSFYLRISDTRFLVVIKQIPGRNDDKSTFQDIKETLNNTVGSAAASAYQKITGNEYGKTLTESELAMQNAKNCKSTIDRRRRIGTRRRKILPLVTDKRWIKMGNF